MRQTACGLLLLLACSPEAETPRLPRLDWPDEVPAQAFVGRVDVELCNLLDDDGDGELDEGCDSPCQGFVTRSPEWWQDAGCVLEGQATGDLLLPVRLGASDTFSTPAEVAAALAVDPQGDAFLKLRRNLLTLRLNAAAFGLSDREVIDWDLDGDLETVAWMMDKADAHYDGGVSWYQNVLVEELRYLNGRGLLMPPWFDEACAAPPERCNGVDDDLDQEIDEACGCFEACGDGRDDDLDGLVDEACAPCSTEVTRNFEFWADAACVLDGGTGVPLLPLRLGDSELYATADAVREALLADSGGESRLRLRRHLLTARLNAHAFGLGPLPAADRDGDGSAETWDALLQEAEDLYDHGLYWQRNAMTLLLRELNLRSAAAPAWFDPDCLTLPEICDGRDNDGDGTADESCGCAEICDGLDNDGDGSADEDWPGGCPDGQPWTFVSMPDLANCDIADLTGLSTWDAGDNGTSPEWEATLAYLLDRIALQAPDRILVAGDLVNGQWHKDHDGRGLFGPTDTWSVTPATIAAAARVYYPAWWARFAQRDMAPLVVLGDHELGNDPWPAYWGESWYVASYRRAFAEAFMLGEDGQHAFALRPVGTAWEDTAWALVQDDTLIVGLDAFRQDHAEQTLDDRTGTVLVTVDGGQLSWLDELLDAAAADPALDHVFVMLHTPVLQPVRSLSSSSLFVRDQDGTTSAAQASQGAETELWKTLEAHDVDLVLAGEVHAVTLSQAVPDGTIQLVHGAHLGRSSPFTWLRGEVWADRIELELWGVPIEFQGEAVWQTGPSCSVGLPVIDEQTRADGPSLLASARIDLAADKRRVVDASGLLVPYP